MVATRFTPRYSGQGWNAGGYNPSGWMGVGRNENFADGFGGAVHGLTGRRYLARRFSDERLPRSQQRSQNRSSRRSRSRSRNDSEGSRDKKDGDKKKDDIKALKLLGIALAITSAASISLGISNTAVTATTVMTTATDSGCFKESQWYEQLGPKNDAMRGLDWSWVTVGLWSAILTYLAGMLVGKITQKSTTMLKLLMVLTLSSLVAFLPARFILSILDTLLSSSCQESNTPKFALPIVVAVLSVVEFILLLVVLLRLRKQVKKWKEGGDEEIDGDEGGANGGDERMGSEVKGQRKYGAGRGEGRGEGEGNNRAPTNVPTTNIFFPVQPPVLVNPPQQDMRIRTPIGQRSRIALRWASRPNNRGMYTPNLGI